MGNRILTERYLSSMGFQKEHGAYTYTHEMMSGEIEKRLVDIIQFYYDEKSEVNPSINIELNPFNL